MNKENAIELRWKLLNLPGKIEVVGQSDLPAIVFFRYTTDHVADITGQGAGKGGKARARAARTVGVGEDSDVTRAQREQELMARSKWIADLLDGEQELGRALMLLAGGRNFLAGARIGINDNGMAARAARYIFRLRGSLPSNTSMEEAAAAAAELVLQVSVWEYVHDLETLPAARLREDACLRSHLAGCAWRAAFHSMTDDAAAESGATNGRQAGEQPGGVSLALTAGQIASQRASLEAWARGERLLEDTADATARRAVCCWLWRSLVPAAARGANGKRELDGARRRARFLIRLVHGASWADAARLAGYVDGAMASKKLAESHTWAALARAQASEAGGHPLAVALRRQWARAARAEVRARRAARVYLNTTAPRGARRMGGVHPVGAVLPGGGLLVCGWRGSPAPRVSGKVRALAVNIGAAARRAIDAREQAARITTGARARLLAFRARAAKSWETASRGLRRGFLRQ